MPTPRKPDAVKLAQGTLRPCRILREESPMEGLSETAPAGLTKDAREAWSIAVKYAPPGRLTVCDAAILERWCRTYALYRKIAKRVEHGDVVIDEGKGLKLHPDFAALQSLNSILIKLEKELGFTPVSRVRAPAREEDDGGDNPFDV